MDKKRFLSLGLSAVLSASLLAGCSGSEPTTFTGYAMGTVVNETLYTDGDDITTLIEKDIKSLENDIISDRVKRSEIYKINQNAGKGSTKISDELNGYLKTLLKVSHDSGGAFDPAIGGLSALWDFDNDAENIPDESDIRSVLDGCDYKDISLSGNSITIPNGMKLNLGAAGKGIALDRVKEILDDEDELTGAVISVGESSILTYGSSPNGDDWTIAVRDPRDKEKLLGSLHISGTSCIGTSGDYQKYFVKNGRRYHHILDPKTGYPADSDVMSVTVVCESGILSDALSTACFILGKDKGMALAESYGAEAMFVTADQEIVMSDGMKSMWENAE